MDASDAYTVVCGSGSVVLGVVCKTRFVERRHTHAHTPLLGLRPRPPRHRRAGAGWPAQRVRPGGNGGGDGACYRRRRAFSSAHTTLGGCWGKRGGLGSSYRLLGSLQQGMDKYNYSTSTGIRLELNSTTKCNQRAIRVWACGWGRRPMTFGQGADHSRTAHGLRFGELNT